MKRETGLSNWKKGIVTCSASSPQATLFTLDAIDLFETIKHDGEYHYETENNYFAARGRNSIARFCRCGEREGF